MFMDEQNEQNKKDSPPSTLLREEVMKIGEKEIVTETEAYVQKEDGSIVRQNKTNYQITADGRFVKSKDFHGMSYTGLLVPEGSLSACLNPFELHDQYRLVYLNVDGFITNLGNVLCRECRDLQSRRLFWKNILLFGLLYNPKEF